MTKFFVDNDKKNGYLEYVENNYKINSIGLIKKIMKRVDNYEMFKSKSVESFSKDDFKAFFKALNTLSKRVLDTYKSVINSYIAYNSDTNETNSEISKVDLNDCINTKKESLQLITEPEYYEILEGKGNYQDKAVIVLLWNKVRGYKEFSEIINLKYEDIDTKNGIINIEDENNPRQVQITPYEMNILEKAFKENVYHRKKEEKGLITNIPSDLKDGKYLIKSSIGTINKKVITNKSNYHSLENRMSDYFKLTLERKELTPVLIYKSSAYYSIIKEYSGPLKYNALIKYKIKNKLKISLSNAFREQDIMFMKMEKQNLVPHEVRSNDVYSVHMDIEDIDIEDIDIEDIDIEDFKMEDSIENMNINDIDNIDNLNPNIFIYEFNLKNKKIKNSDNTYSNGKEDDSSRLSEKLRYHLGIIGEKLINKLLLDKNEKLLLGLGLNDNTIIDVIWYNELYNKNDEKWEDKSIGKGHDIAIKTNKKSIYLEIKTSYNNIKYYDLTTNEVITNNEFREDYYVIKILNVKYLYNSPHRIDIKIIRNPLGIFNNSSIVRSISVNL